MHLLDNVIQEYAWGSHTALAELLGAATPSAKPQAELWMGAHPSAPSRIRGAEHNLLDLLQSAPEALLGAQVTARHGPALPFLLKVLAAGQPLSLQAHPSLAQAREGFARENAQGIALSAPHRNYKDANHKPEILCALGPFEALCGFRSVRESLRLFEQLAVPALKPVVEALRGDDLQTAFRSLLGLAFEARASLVAAVTARAQVLTQQPGPFVEELRWSLRLAALHPSDVGSVSALLLNLVHLEEGQAIYLPAGNLHAYLRGTGVELMANSDNVLRGGLTPKHVDVAELLKVLDFREIPATPLRAERDASGEQIFRTEAPDFRLSRLEVEGPALTLSPRGPEILLCTAGTLTVRGALGSCTLGKGASVFISAGEGPYSVEGKATVYRATPGGD